MNKSIRAKKWVKMTPFERVKMNLWSLHVFIAANIKDKVTILTGWVMVSKTVFNFYQTFLRLFGQITSEVDLYGLILINQAWTITPYDFIL